MGIVMKEGMVQYNGQPFLISEDSGKSWKIDVIPDTTLYNIRVGDKYWTVGTEESKIGRAHV